MKVAALSLFVRNRKAAARSKLRSNAPTPAGQAAQCLTVSESMRVADLVVPAWVYTTSS